MDSSVDHRLTPGLPRKARIPRSFWRTAARGLPVVLLAGSVAGTAGAAPEEETGKAGAAAPGVGGIVVDAERHARSWRGHGLVMDMRIEDHPDPVPELRRIVTLQIAYDMLDDDEPVAPEVCREDGRPWWGDERRPITPGQEAARALVRIGSASFDPLLNTLTSTGPTGRRNAAWALGALRDQRAVPSLTASLRDSDPRVREQAAWAIGVIAH